MSWSRWERAKVGKKDSRKSLTRERRKFKKREKKFDKLSRKWTTHRTKAITLRASLGRCDKPRGSGHPYWISYNVTWTMGSLKPHRRQTDDPIVTTTDERDLRECLAGSRKWSRTPPFKEEEETLEKWMGVGDGADQPWRNEHSLFWRSVSQSYLHFWNLEEENKIEKTTLPFLLFFLIWWFDSRSKRCQVATLEEIWWSATYLRNGIVFSSSFTGSIFLFFFCGWLVFAKEVRMSTSL